MSILGHIVREGALRLTAAGATDTGCVRLHNEDAYSVDVNHGIFIVADGVGGRQYGDVAARMAATVLPRIIISKIAEAPDPASDDDPGICEILRASVIELGRQIHSWSQEAPESAGMGTTVVVAMVTAHHVHIVYMGDSRAYVYRDGVLTQLTRDHSVVGLLQAHGEISTKEAKDHPARGKLTRYVGMEGEVWPDVRTLPVISGDRLLLCTDGLWGMLGRGDIAIVLEEFTSAEEAVRELILLGKQAGGLDNLTAMVVNFDGGNESHEADPSRCGSLAGGGN